MNVSAWASTGAQLRLLALILRIAGVLTGAAFLAVFLPADWMAYTHEVIGLGVFPRAPIVDYLTRSVALMYGFHGILMFIVARDPLRYRPIVNYIAAMDLIFGIAIAVIDIQAGMPWYWTIGECLTITGLGVVIAVLSRSLGHAATAVVA